MENLKIIYALVGGFLASRIFTYADRFYDLINTREEKRDQKVQKQLTDINNCFDCLEKKMRDELLLIRNDTDEKIQKQLQHNRKQIALCVNHVKSHVNTESGQYSTSSALGMKGVSVLSEALSKKDEKILQQYSDLIKDIENREEEEEMSQEQVQEDNTFRVRGVLDTQPNITLADVPLLLEEN